MDRPRLKAVRILPRGALFGLDHVTDPYTAHLHSPGPYKAPQLPVNPLSNPIQTQRAQYPLIKEYVLNYIGLHIMI